MPTFRVLRRVDAWIDYIVEVEAENALRAAAIAYETDMVGRRIGEEEFWNARFATLDEQGGELAETVITRGC